MFLFWIGFFFKKNNLTAIIYFHFWWIIDMIEIQITTSLQNQIPTHINTFENFVKYLWKKSRLMQWYSFWTEQMIHSGKKHKNRNKILWKQYDMSKILKKRVEYILKNYFCWNMRIRGDACWVHRQKNSTISYSMTCGPIQ